MASIVIPNVAESTLNKLREQAAVHGRTPEAEAKAILEGQLQAVQSQTQAAPIWAQVNAFRRKMAASGRLFGDSAELLREDRDR